MDFKLDKNLSLADAMKGISFVVALIIAGSTFYYSVQQQERNINEIRVKLLDLERQINEDRSKIVLIENRQRDIDIKFDTQISGLKMCMDRQTKYLSLIADKLKVNFIE